MRHRIGPKFWLLGLALVVAAGCGGGSGKAAGGDRSENGARRSKSAVVLRCHAGAGIRPPLDELGERFRKKTGVSIEYNYKGSGCLLADISFSKKGDIYIPGEEFYARQAHDRGFLKSYVPIAYFATVIITPKGNPKGIKTLADLAKKGVRLGIGDLKATAIGEPTKRMLTKAGVWDDVQPNIVMKCLNIVEIANAVKLGKLDAGIVWDATAFLVRDSVETIRIPREFVQSTAIPAGVLTFSKHPKEACQFVSFLQSAEAKKIFKAHGYDTEDPSK